VLYRALFNFDLQHAKSLQKRQFYRSRLCSGLAKYHRLPLCSLGRCQSKDKSGEMMNHGVHRASAAEAAAAAAAAAAAVAIAITDSECVALV